MFQGRGAPTNRYIDSVAHEIHSSVDCREMHDDLGVPAREFSELDRGVPRLLFALQSVARGNLEHAGLGWKPSCVLSHKFQELGSLRNLVSGGEQNSFTDPSAGELMVCSIFIASMTGQWLRIPRICGGQVQSRDLGLGHTLTLAATFFDSERSS